MLSWLRQLMHQLDPRVDPPSPEFIELSPDRTELRYRSVSTVFDTRARSVTRNGSLLTTFDRISSVGVMHVRDPDGSSESWHVVLHTGQMFSPTVLQTGVDVDASIAAAQIARITGKRVGYP